MRKKKILYSVAWHSWQWQIELVTPECYSQKLLQVIIAIHKAAAKAIYIALDELIHTFYIAKNIWLEPIKVLFF